ncbi:MAG: Mur ligase family protein, partial [Chitinophagaceae bacterium]
MAHKYYILGAGESGAGAAVLAAKQGYDVFVSDGGVIKDIYKKELASFGIAFEEGGHNVDKILQADQIMKSPGIPETAPIVKAIRAKGIPVESEIELAWRFKGKSKIIGITGSNGKTTTTALTYHICKHAGVNCALVGNIGESIA